MSIKAENNGKNKKQNVHEPSMEYMEPWILHVRTDTKTTAVT